MLYVLDTSAILNEPNFSFDPNHRYIATPEVVAELKSFEVRHLAENALHHGLLEIRACNSHNLVAIQQLVRSHGFQKLSPTDLTVIALAQELQQEGQFFEVLTDDYSIQNFLALLSISFASVIMPKITDIIEFELKCANCAKKFALNTYLKECDFCGGKIRRKQAIRQKIGVNKC